MNPRPPPERLSDQLLRERKQRERRVIRPVIEVMLILATTMALGGGAYALVLALGGPAWTGDLLIPIGALLTFAFGRKRIERIDNETRARRRGFPHGHGDTRDEA